jgi:hypothetical protein
MLAGVYNKGIVVCDPRHRTPLPGWIKAGPEIENLRDEINRRLHPPKQP